MVEYPFLRALDKIIFGKNNVFISCLPIKTLMCAHWEHLIETLPLSTNNISFLWKTREKKEAGYHYAGYHSYLGL